MDEVAGGRHAPQHTESELPTEPAKSDLEDGDEGTNEDTSNVFDDQEELQTQKVSCYGKDFVDSLVMAYILVMV